MFTSPFRLRKATSRTSLIAVVFLAFMLAGALVYSPNGLTKSRQTSDSIETKGSSLLTKGVSADDLSACGLGISWDETEGGLGGVWTRRSSTNVFDAIWPSRQITAVLTINLQGNNVTVARRQSSDGNDCDYVGTIAADGVTVQGTYQCTRFPPTTGWQATIRCPNCTAAPANMVAWWRGEGNANDSIGSNNGTLLNGASFASGMVGQGFNLNGNTQYVVVPHSDSINPTAALTVETWAKVNNLPTGNPWSIVTKDNPGGGPYDLTIFGDGRAVFGVYTNGWQQVYAPAGSIVPGNFAHLAGTYESTTGQLCLYVNGAPTCGIAQAGNIPRHNSLKIGGSTWYNTYVNGIIDEVSIYNRALSPAEIQSIYAAGSDGKCSPGLAPLGVAYRDTRIIDAYPNVSAVGRTPVILIHGLHGNRKPGCEGEGCDSVGDLNDPNAPEPYPHYFKNLILHLQSSPDYQNGYKTYKFHWVSDKWSTEDLAIALRDHIDRDSRFTDKNVIIVTHSTGGLIARWYMLQKTFAGSTFYDQESGVRVQKLITLAAPHHGTYGANQKARLDEFAPVPRGIASLLFPVLDNAYWKGAGCSGCANNVQAENRNSLLWDNYDGRFQNISAYPEERGGLPPTSNYNNKITAYYGELDMTDPYWAAVAYGGGLPHALAAQVIVGNDNIGSAVGAYFVNAVDRGVFSSGVSRPGNDGLVPVDSGRFANAPNGIGQSISCVGNNHARMRDGSGRLCSDNQALLTSVRNKIMGVTPPSPGILTSIGYALYGRLPIFSQATEHRSAVETASDPNVSLVELTNSGNQSLHITSLNIGGTDAGQFSLVQPPTLPLTIPANSSVSVKVGFNPTSVGPKVAELNALNDSSNPLVVVPLYGTGFPQPCNLTLSPSSGFVAAVGGTSVINVGSIPCQMSVSASESWLHPMVVGNHVEFITDPNTGTVQRDGVVFISLNGGPTLPFGVSQSPANQPCGLNFSAEQALIPTVGGNSGFEVTTPTNCSWTYQSDSAWLTLGTSGVLTGPQQVTFNAPAATSSRTANITVTDGTMTGEFTITQPGPANISGRVLNRDGRGVTNATVTLESNSGSPITFRTNRYGYYHFDNLPAGIIYSVRVSSRRYSFESRFVQLVDALSDVDFTANP